MNELYKNAKVSSYITQYQVFRTDKGALCFTLYISLKDTFLGIMYIIHNK